MDRCPYCGEIVYRNNSRRIFIVFGEGPSWGGYSGWGHYHGGGGWGGHGGHGHRRNEG